MPKPPACALTVVLTAAVCITAAACAPSANLSRPCSAERGHVELCLIEGSVVRRLHRLSETNLIDPPRDRPSESQYRSRLHLTSLFSDELQLVLAPVTALQTLELDLYESTAALGAPPIRTAQCLDECDFPGATARTSDGQRRLTVAGDELPAGGVLVVGAFVETEREVGFVSWGLEVR